VGWPPSAKQKGGQRTAATLAQASGVTAALRQVESIVIQRVGYGLGTWVTLLSGYIGNTPAIFMEYSSMEVAGALEPAYDPGRPTSIFH
jgi:hypothetical protein